MPRKVARRPVVEAIASWSAGHRLIAILGWLAMVGGAVLAGHLYGTASVPQYDPGQSGVAERMLDNLHVVSPPSESVLIQSRLPGPQRGFESNPHMLLAAHQVVSALQTLPGTATDIRSPFGHFGKELVAPGGGSVLITFVVAGPQSNTDATVANALSAVARIQAQHPDLIVAEAGGASVDRAATAMMGSDFRQAELTSIPLTLLLLLLVFGAVVAAGIPVILAGTAVVTTVSLLAIPSRWLPVGQGTSEVVLIIGMAVGVDYTLFYLRREREERAAGASFLQALRTAAATSGRAVVISGLTVMISLAGLFFTGIDMFTGFAIGTITVVGVAVVGSLTALPAVLSLLGPWADRGRIPFLGRSRTEAGRSRLWSALVRRVVRRPLIWGGIAMAALGALALPALGMRTGSPAINLPTSMPVVSTLMRIQHDFPGQPAPAQVVVSGAGVRTVAMDRAIAELQAAARTAPAISAGTASATGTGSVAGTGSATGTGSAPGTGSAAGTGGAAGAVSAVSTGNSAAGLGGGLIHGPVTVAPVGAGQGMLISVPLAGDGNSALSQRALAALRERILPATLGRVSRITYAVTGSTANSADFSGALSSSAPVVFGIVAGLAFLILLVSFRSLAIPLVSIGLNLLSVGAAYGLITVIFQQGHLQGLLGFTSFGAVMDWVPLFMFVFLFGLSMDYHVFILSRIRELWRRGSSTADAVVGGISNGAGVVTSAAVIMVAVFSIFASLSTIDLKMIGVGLAFAVLVDATVVRGICVPAVLALLGERSWYLPRWLRWIPHGLSA